MNPLEISAEEFRRLAELASGAAGSYLSELPDAPAFPQTSGEATLAAFDQPLPQEGMGAEALVAIADVFRHSRPPSPRFFGYVFGSGDPVGAVGDLLASVLNQNVTAWRSAPAAVTIERVVVGWLAEAIGCPGFVGSLCGGGSSANLMGLAMAREAHAAANEDGARPAVIYASTEVHMSIAKAVALLGIGRRNLRLIAVDEGFRMVPKALRSAIQADRERGMLPLAIVASAGTVNTGSIDPLSEIAAIAREHHLWLHVDGAYGVLAAITIPEKFSGLAEADSLSLDPHKWLYQPVDCGCLLFRDPAAARAAFAHTGEYARSLSQNPVEGFAFFEESVELSRRFRALKLWLALRYHGLHAFRAAVRQDLDHARLLARRISQTPEMELLAPVELSAVCFRHRAASNPDAFNAAVLRRVIQRGRVYISNASIRGQFALRACIVNHRSTDEDVLAIVDEVLAAGREVGARSV
jgi:aromatic-L-amino-acid decarboxylase